MLINWEVFILAIIQGLTEFLPVSSSGHLVLAKHFLGLETPGATLEIVLHAGTLLSILVFYLRRIFSLGMGILKGREEDRRYIMIIVISTIPAAVIGLLLKGFLEPLFNQPKTVAAMLCVTGIFLLSLRFAKQSIQKLNAPRGVLVGIAQVFALAPGISRSGSTIVMARHLGIEPERAAEFSFLLAVPALIGAIGLAAIHGNMLQVGNISVPTLLMGVTVSAFVGYAALSWLVKILSSGKFWWFGVYSLWVGILGIVFL